MVSYASILKGNVPAFDGFGAESIYEVGHEPVVNWAQQAEGHAAAAHVHMDSGNTDAAQKAMNDCHDALCQARMHAEAYKDSTAFDAEGHNVMSDALNSAEARTAEAAQRWSVMQSTSGGV